jgi:hypothetical protein
MSIYGSSASGGGGAAVPKQAPALIKTFTSIMRNLTTNHDKKTAITRLEMLKEQIKLKLPVK